MEFKSKLILLLNHSINSSKEQSSSNSRPFSSAIEAALSYKISSNAIVFYVEFNNLSTKVLLISELD